MKDNNNLLAYHHHFKKSKWIIIRYGIIILFALIFSLFIFHNHLFTIIVESILSFIALSFIISMLFFRKYFNSVLNGKNIISISNLGLYSHKHQQFIPWKDIKSMRIVKVNYFLSILFYNNEISDDLYIYFKEDNKNEFVIDIQGLENRKTLVALSDYYIEKFKKNPTITEFDKKETVYFFKIVPNFHLLKISISIVIFILGFYFINNLFILSMVLFAISSVFFAFSMVDFSKTNLVKITKEGIWSKQYDTIPWNKIISVRVDDISFFNQLFEKDYMIVFLKNKKRLYIDITGIEKRNILRSKIAIYLS